jgi:hypothetical protein
MEDLQSIESAAGTVGINIQALAISSSGDLETVLAGKTSVDAEVLILATAGPILSANQAAIAELRQSAACFQRLRPGTFPDSAV